VELDWPAIHAAAHKLEGGELVAFPTETVYGLGADAENPAAVAKIYAAKGRPSNHPVIVHLAPGADIHYWAQSVPPEAHKLIDAFWPGPLTLILKRAAHIPDCVSGGQDSIGLRCPSHPVAQALLKTFKNAEGGIAAPSANKFGHVSPTTAEHVHDEFKGDALVRTILDGGQSEVGIESTILDLSRIATHGAVLLRPGQISMEQIATVLGSLPNLPDTAAPRASGTLEAHYAPRTPVALISADRLPALLKKLDDAGRRTAIIHFASNSVDKVVANYTMPSNAAGYAHDLYDALRAMDAAGSDVILIVAPPGTDQWLGVNDRLRRAAFDSAGILDRLFSNS
jgi:L-threonylcarbamoyladenylate synthase